MPINIDISLSKLVKLLITLTAIYKISFLSTPFSFKNNNLIYIV